MTDWELLSTGLVAVSGAWAFLRVLGKSKHHRERILEVLHRRALRDLRARKMLEGPPDELARPAPDGNGEAVVVGPPSDN